jgi:hypothetical protein
VTIAAVHVPLLDTAPWPIVPALFVAVFALLTASGYWLHLRTLRVTPAATHVARSPDERARAALDSAAPLADIDARAYYGCIAAALRSYLAGRFRLPHHALPRPEFEARSAGAGIDAETAQLAASLLERCDAARLGGDPGDAARRAADLAAARAIIERSSTHT